MKTEERVAICVAVLASPASAYALSEGGPGGTVLFAVGFGLGLGAGLLWCWWRCRHKKADDRPPLK